MSADKYLRVSDQIVINLIKHAATLEMGDDARKVVAETWLDFKQSSFICIKFADAVQSNRGTSWSIKFLKKRIELIIIA
ncbi:MAG: hypothetical protein H8D34_22395 [Chloroflexi bacterium]|nr:hypothetical protein [Chloroflexota bacterium]